MSDSVKYLKPNVVLEPLVDQWYAWSHLISPATAAMNILDRHVTIMESYLSAPDIHAQAVSNPKMRGGPFMDLKGNRSKDISALLNRTRQGNARLLEFARAVKDLDRLL